MGDDQKDDEQFVILSEEQSEDDQHFIFRWKTVVLFFLIFPLLGLWLPETVRTPDDQIQLVVPEITPVLVLGTGALFAISLLFLLDWLRVQRHPEPPQTETTVSETTVYLEQYHTARSLASSLITAIGVFISLLGASAFFGGDQASPSSALIVVFLMLVLAAILGFFSLSELSSGVNNQMDRGVTMASDIWLRFWYYAKYTLLALIVAVLFLTVELVLS